MTEAAAALTLSRFSAGCSSVVITVLVTELPELERYRCLVPGMFLRSLQESGYVFLF